jgi:hypothetical protein
VSLNSKFECVTGVRVREKSVALGAGEQSIASKTLLLRQPDELFARGYQWAAYQVYLSPRLYKGRFADTRIAVPAALVVAEEFDNLIRTLHRVLTCLPSYRFVLAHGALHAFCIGDGVRMPRWCIKSNQSCDGHSGSFAAMARLRGPLA